MTVLREETVAWLSEALDNPGGLVRLNDPDTRCVLVSDEDLGDCLLLGLVARWPAFELHGFGGFALTPRGRLYLERLAQAKARGGGLHDRRACRRNPFDVVAREREGRGA